ncbi:MAG: hypothetical protein U0802_24095 [Candidatus Binatia bacterium]
MTVDDWNGKPVVALSGAAPDGRATLLLFVSPTCRCRKTVLAIVDSLLGGSRDGRGCCWPATAARRAPGEAFVRDEAWPSAATCCRASSASSTRSASCPTRCSRSTRPMLRASW